MSLSNLPPGVTGMEDHFGPQSAKTEHRWCPECEDDVEGEVEFWNSGITFTCVEGHVHDEDPEDYGPDPDRQRDEAMERDW